MKRILVVLVILTAILCTTLGDRVLADNISGNITASQQLANIFSEIRQMREDIQTNTRNQEDKLSELDNQCEELKSSLNAQPPSNMSLRDFNSRDELVKWRNSIGLITGVENERARKLQKRAFADRYILSIRLDYRIGCLAVVGERIYRVNPDDLSVWKIGDLLPSIEKDLDD